MDAAGTVMQVVWFESELSEEEVMRTARERQQQFLQVPGLLQKYYVKRKKETKEEEEEEGGEERMEYGGVYVWESDAALAAYRASPLAHSIPSAYRIRGTPSVHVFPISFSLR